MITKFELINPMETIAPRNGKGVSYNFPYEILKAIKSSLPFFEAIP